MRTIAFLMVGIALSACQYESNPLAIGEASSMLSSQAAETTTTSERLPFDAVFDVPCADGGAGELVAAIGELHVLSHVSVDANGGFHAQTHVQPMGVSGVGQTTGTSYQGTGATREAFNGIVGETSTITNVFRLVAHGREESFHLHQNVHLTVNANGDVTSMVDNSSVECR